MTSLYSAPKPIVYIAAQRCRHDCLYRVHTVLRFLEYHRLRPLKDLVGHLHLGHAEFLAYLLADSRLEVVIRGQTVHEYCARRVRPSRPIYPCR